LEVLSNSWWIILAVVALIVLAVVHRNRRNKRRMAQFKADESFIQHFVDDLDFEDKQTYKDLPNRDARLTWLKRHYPEFLAAAERHYKDKNITGVVAVYVDFKLLKNVCDYTSREQALSSYQSLSYRKSLNEHQEFINEQNELLREQEEVRRKEAARLAEAERKRREAAAVEEKARKEAAKQYWNSLTSEQKEDFKKAKGATARKNTLPSPSNSSYPVDVLYAAIMTTQFSDVSSTNSNSIDYCQSPSYSSYDSGSSSSHGSGSYSSYDSGSSSSDSGGGGGCD
jgi:hypothetical protein